MRTNGPLDKLADKLRELLNRVHAGQGDGAYRWFNPTAARMGSRVGVVYRSYQGWSKLTRAEAEKYLAYLESGGTERHYEAFRKEKP